MKISFREVLIEDAKMILDWRVKPNITEMMLTDVVYDLEAQKKWIESCYHKKDYYHWIIQADGIDIGLVNFALYQPEKRLTHWGMYIGEDKYLGSGFAVMTHFYNWAFKCLPIDTIRTECFEHNKVIQVHTYFGYIFRPELNFTVEKNGKKMLLIVQDLKKENFTLEIENIDFPMKKWCPL